MTLNEMHMNLLHQIVFILTEPVGLIPLTVSHRGHLNVLLLLRATLR